MWDVMWDEFIQDAICDIIDRLQLQFACNSISYKYYAETDTAAFSVIFPDMVIKTIYNGFAKKLHSGQETAYTIFKTVSKQLSSNLYKRFCKHYYRQKP